MLADLLDDEGGLHGELTDRHEHHCLNLVQTGVDFLDEWDAIRCSLSSSILGLSDDVDIIDDLGDGLLLDRGWQFETHFKDALQTIDMLDWGREKGDLG